MRKFYTFFLASIVSLVFYLPSAKAQCPSPIGMTVVPVSFSGVCFLNIQFAIPNSTIFVYNASGFVTSGTASATGSSLIPFPCGAYPITSINSVKASPAQFCSQYTITALVTLPVKLTAFTATFTKNKTVLLNWESAMELENDRYEIEKSSDGINFTKLNSLNSTGSGLSNRNYNFEDAFFAKGSSAFYRLKQVDNDGKFSYSKVIYISDKTSASSDYAIFPNPLNSSNTFQIKGIAANEVNYNNIRITDLAGRNIGYTITGANSIELNSAANSGVYLLRIKETTLKLIKN